MNLEDHFVAQRKNYGGARKGSGRPPGLPKRKFTIYLTDKEKAACDQLGGVMQAIQFWVKKEKLP